MTPNGPLGVCLEFLSLIPKVILWIPLDGYSETMCRVGIILKRCVLDRNVGIIWKSSVREM